MKKIINLIISMVIGMMVGLGIMRKKAEDKIDKIQAISDKHLALLQLMSLWVKIKQENKSICKYFESMGYKNIAIYGMSYVGERLLEELKNTDINVLYAIDKNADSIYTEIEMLSMDDDFIPVDAIVITAITFFDEIREEVLKKVDCPIVSLEDILYDI